MQRISIITGILLAALISLPIRSIAHSPKQRHVVIDERRLQELPAEQQAEVLRIADRLEAIIATDPKSLSRPERAAMRDEWRALKREMKAHNQGGTVIYISGLGLILLIILLIVLL